MTVAIRAFRMEMEEASHVTDVYSKVAAVTASDTEELITAMSKTASSAEAVGSSFENTTAMLAVMIEATRESATNIGSAMKSIISRYGEMKEGMSADTEGEGIAYNKVDEALQSIGMTLKDTNGQFRDFDDVIEELASKWDTLDSLQQRYIATIFAGNRQQSRFLALVSNYDRYMEVSAAAADAEDAGLLQYSKTLDSLETKLNNLSTSFQQFYMSIANGAIFGGAIEGITKFVEGLNKLGNFSAIMNIVGILRSLKLVTKTAVNAFTTMTSQIRNNVETVFTQIASSMVAKMRQAGSDSSRAIEEGAQQGAQGLNPNSPGKAVISPKIGKAINVVSLVGAGLSIAGTGVAADNAVAGSWMTTAGSALSYGSQGAMIGSAIAPGIGTAIGAAIGVLAGALSQIPALINAYANQAQEALDKATKEAEEKNIERAQAAEDYRSLESTIENLKKLQAARYDSEEAEKAFADAQKEAAEKFPELISGYTATGEAIVDVVNGSVNAELILADARKKAADATLEAAAADLNKANKEAVVKNQDYRKYLDLDGYISNFDYKNIQNLKANDTSYYGLSDDDAVEYYLFPVLNTIKNLDELEQRKQNYISATGKASDEAYYDAIMDQYWAERERAYADLLAVNATQSQKQRIEISAALSQSLASDLNPDLWTKSGAISSLVSNAFTSSFFNKDGTFNKKYDDYFDSEGKIKATQITGDIATFFEKYQDFFNQLGTEEEIADFEQLIADVDKGQYSADQLKQVLEDQYNITDEQAELYNAFFTPINNAIERTKNKIEASDFSSAFGNEAALDAFLQTLPTTILNNISSFITDLQNKIDNKQINEEQAEKILSDYKDFIGGIFSPNSGLTYSQQMTAANIIAQGDMTTLFGQYQIQQQLDEALGEGKIDLIRKNDKGKWESEVGTAVENVVLSYQAFSESLATSVNSISDAFKYASSGFELEDAQKIADKVGKDVKSLFTFDEGKWFINPESFDEVYKAYTNAAEEQKDLLGQQKDKALASINTYLNDNSNATAEDIQAFNANVEGAKNYYKKKNPGAMDDTWDALDAVTKYNFFEEYLNFIEESTTAAMDEQLEWLQKDLNKRTAVANYTSKVKDKAYGSKGYDWYEAINILSQKGSSTGFSPEEAGKLIAEGLFKEEDFFEDGTGNLRVTEAAYRNALSEGGQYLVDQYDISLAEKTSQLSDSVLTLGKSSIAGTTSDSDWLKLAQDLGIQDINERGIQQLKKFFSSDKYDSFWGSIYALAFNMSEEDLKALRQEYQTGTALGTQELTEKTLDYYAKVLDGELTDVDIAALDGELGAAVQAFANNTSSQIDTYINTLLADTSMSFSDKVSNLASRYKNQLERENPTFSSPELIANNTRMSSSQASEMLAELNLLLDGEKKYTIDDLFSYNVADQTYSLIGKNYQTALKELEAAIDNEPADSDRQKQLKNYLDQMRSAASEAFFANAQSASETIEKFATSTEMTFKDIQSIYSEVGGYISAAEASKMAAELNELDPWARIERLIEIYNDFGITLDSGKYNEIVNTVFDSILSEISDAISKLSSGLSGKLSFSDFQKLIDQGYVTEAQGRVSYKGVQLTAEGRQSYLTKLYQKAKDMGNTFGLGEEIWGTLSDSQNQVFDGYKEIEDEISRIEGELSQVSDQPDKQNLEAYLSLLKEVRAAAMFDPNSAEFNFMNLDSTEGMTKNFDQFVSSIESVKSAFDTLRSGGDIGYNEFYNMMGFIEKYVSNSALQTKLDEFGLKINDFATAVVESSDEIGKVDLDGIAAKLGISASAAADLISSDMSQGLKDIAQQQVDYLTGIENMLKAMAAIDGTDAEMALKFTYTDGKGEKVDFNFMEETWQQFSNLEDYQQKEIEVQFKANFGVDLTEATLAIAKQMNSPEFRGFLATMSPDLAESVGATIYEAMSNPESLGIFDKNGNLVDNYEEIIGDFFTDVINGVNLSNFSTVVQERLNELFKQYGQTITVDNSDIQYNLTIDKSNIKINASSEDIEAAKSDVNKKLKQLGLEIDKEISANEETGTYTYSVKPTVEAAEGALISDSSITTANTELDDLSSKLTALDILTVTPTVSIVVDGLAALNRAVALMAQLGAKTSSASSQTIPKVIKPRATAALMFSGSMNGIGPAFADGSIGRLRAGASFAQKTLVGELGPELAVYDGQYHLLGKDGAEFVKLPDDAIVFNHLQTQGIMSGQMNIRGMTMASGSISGPALANGNIAQALAAVQRAKAVWQGLLNKLSASDILGSGGGGGGGGGGDDKTAAVIQDLQEWYNLSRQIANIEQEINNIVAERENIVDGGAYLRSLRQQQELLEDQKSIQKILLDYQNKQLQRQADLINNDRIWSKFLTVGEGGLLQYTVGNETNGGKGALQVLDELNKMSGEEQIKYMSSIGYSYTDTDGNKLEGTELVTKFFEELQKQIDEYDALYDTVHETKQTIEELKSSIEEINEEIIQNQKDLEKSIYDIIINAWQKQIDMLDEQAKLVKEVNDNYVQGLNDALQLEQERYQQNQEIADRESLQRQLSLLRRSGGSASEIANLEKQLDEKLKDEYFNNQQKAINQIQEANEKQVEQLERQIQIQKEALDYQKENGVIWTKVYDVMAGQKEEILQFMQGNSTDFFSKSALEQEAMLTEWAKKIGIYTEDKKYQDYSNQAQQKYWATGAVWGQQGLSSFKSLFDSLSDEEKAEIQKAYISTYAEAMLRGADEAAASEQAAKEMLASLSNKQKATAPTPPPTPAHTSNPVLGETEPAPQKRYRVKYTVVFTNGETESGSGIGNSAYAAKATAEMYAKKKKKNSKGYPQRNVVYEKAVAFSEGGLVDYTGPAIVHGTPSKPEAFLNAEQTKQIREGLELTSDRGILSSLRAGISDLIHMANSIVNNNLLNNEINISKGAIQITVGNLNDKYDIEDVSNDIMNRIVSIASKATNRGVNRR